MSATDKPATALDAGVTRCERTLPLKGLHPPIEANEANQEPTAMHALRTIPLSSLRSSPGNVRKVGGIPIYTLANSILAHGLLQNLVVTPTGDAFQVEAGGRRLQALQELAKTGKIPSDFPVNCNVIEAGNSAHEASLAENIAREAMHPVDEFLAFKQLADEGHPIAAIADRFGATEKHIGQRLKLASVSPKLLEEYRGGKATLEQMQVLALVDDHARQEKAWAAGARDSWRRRPDSLRDMLTDKEIGTGSALGKFVGAPAFEKAGGVVRRDIFGAAGEAWLTDPGLVEKLAMQKLQAEADRLAGKGWGWVDCLLHLEYNDEYRFTKIGDKPAAHAGVIVTIDRHDGKLRILKGLVKPGTKIPGGTTTAGSAGKAKPARKPGDLPFAQVQRLQGARTAALRVELTKTPRIALAALAATLAQSLTKRDMYGERGGADSIVRVQPVSERFGDGRMAPPARETLETSPLTKALAATRKEWIERLKPAKGEIFAWLLEQPESVTHELLAFVAGTAVNASTFAPEASDDGAKFAAIAGIDLAKHWAVDPKWCAKQTRGYLVAAVTEACGALAAKPLTKAKGPEAAKLAAPLLAKAGWMPVPMRAPKAKKRSGRGAGK